MRRTKAEGKESNEELEDALREAKEENDKRVRDTNQFVQMKKLMQVRLCLGVYISILLASYVMWSGALDRSGVLLSHPIVSPA